MRSEACELAAAAVHIFVLPLLRLWGLKSLPSFPLILLVPDVTDRRANAFSVEGAFPAPTRAE